ncbi:imm11 family protein [Chryseobacterium potabilaquae]|uniref:Uncharacterized protein n=1 Tax=Chryseobacterium potabilaquae TaxID=2675057 RepID=A0A6N4X7J3_9FLAO|nr:DUF1629 domain-containing protein [Chryseobacterium potabilaquae]CAA7196975.1 hypothetical protein CHRY9293_03033 [Chryseobacterium potabilaquae]
MKYYLIRPSLQKKDFGKSYPQAQDAIDNDRDHSNHIEKNFGKKIDFDPLACYPIINKKGRLTDFIGSVVNFGNLQISSKLKSIIEKYTSEGIQYFRNTVLHNDLEYSNYWLLHPYQFDQEYIDFGKSEVIHQQKKKEGGTVPVSVMVSSMEDFTYLSEKAREKNEMMNIEKLSLKENIIIKDFFVLRHVSGGMFYVSEKLKKEIEEAGCTGLEFKPSYLSYNEWMAPNGERDKIYGKV